MPRSSFPLHLEGFDINIPYIVVSREIPERKVQISVPLPKIISDYLQHERALDPHGRLIF
jgi:hypothetical protein